MQPSKSASFPPHSHIPPSLHQGPPPPAEDELKFNVGLDRSVCDDDDSKEEGSCERGTA